MLWLIVLKCLVCGLMICRGVRGADSSPVPLPAVCRPGKSGATVRMGAAAVSFAGKNAGMPFTGVVLKRPQGCFGAAHCLSWIRPEGGVRRSAEAFTSRFRGFRFDPGLRESLDAANLPSHHGRRIDECRRF
jgi:hypothetical protein